MEKQSARLPMIQPLGFDETDRPRGLKKREIAAWMIIIVQAVCLMSLFESNGRQRALAQVSDQSQWRKPSSINGKDPYYHESKHLEAKFGRNASKPFYEPPTYFRPQDGLVSRVWHGNGSPQIHPQLQKGSCWCSSDDYCMCTPSLAVDVILMSGPDHVWLVERADSGVLALVGGFNEVGETVEEAARRELKEETGIDLPNAAMPLFGVYSDPKRDRRKHAVSVVFTMDLPSDVVPQPGDDASKVHRVALQELKDVQMHVDHSLVLKDLVAQRQTRRQLQAVPGVNSIGREPIKRSICSF